MFKVNGTDYQKVELLGTGGFGEVWLVNDIETNKLRVVKDVNLQKKKPNVVNQMKNEIALLYWLSRQLGPDFPVAHLRDHQIEGDHIYLIMDYIPGKTLNSYLQDEDDGKMIAKGQYDEPSRMSLISNIFSQLAFILQTLHLYGVAHRDLKFDNVLVTNDDQVYVIDFGLSCCTNSSYLSANSQFMELNTNCYQKIAGTLDFLSPQMIEKSLTQAKDVFASDVWAFGVLLFVSIYRQKPFSIKQQKDIVSAILQYEDPTTVIWQMIRRHSTVFDEILNQIFVGFQQRITFRDLAPLMMRIYRTLHATGRHVILIDVNNQKEKISDQPIESLSDLVISIHRQFAIDPSDGLQIKAYDVKMGRFVDITEEEHLFMILNTGQRYISFTVMARCEHWEAGHCEKYHRYTTGRSKPSDISHIKKYHHGSTPT